VIGENPYRAAGAFSGKAYIRRSADVELLEQIRDNQYYPYFAAPRQSGKSSLIARTMGSLEPAEYRCALVDLSPFVVRSYDDFWRQFLHEVARSANFDPSAIGQSDPRDVFTGWLNSYKGRLVVFVDEIDVLLHVDCREQIFSKFRTFFNLRAYEASLWRLQFVLAGAAHSSRFISDPRWSPFNVSVEIPLEDLSTAQVSQLATYLATAGAFAGPDLVNRVYELTSGSVFLCQLVFEALWSRAARGAKKLGPADVDAVIETIIAESSRNIHFYNIFRLVTQDARLAMLFRRLVDGEALGEEDRKELELTGLCRGMNPFRNDVYARVFGTGGPLDLKVAGQKVMLGRKLEAALARKQQMQDSGHATEEIDGEIAVLKREFREGAKLREGDVVGRGRYKLVRRLGQGGFATVWLARDEQGQRDVAIKVLHGQFAEDKTRRDRFFRGAWKMSELRHAGIAQVFEPYGEEGGRYYFVMEFLPGGTLHEVVLDKKIGADAVIRAISTIGEALAHAHANGLVHRDIKPSNVLLAADGAAKLTDFDLVREQDGASSTVTGPMGSFIYSAPEVMNRPQDADHRADVYGLAMTALFGLYGGELPLDVVRDADRFIDRLRCGGLVKDVLKKGVAWELEQRFTTVAEFVSALTTAWSEKEPEREEKAAAVVVLPPRAREGAPVAAAALAGAAVASAVAAEDGAPVRTMRVKRADASASDLRRSSAGESQTRGSLPGGAPAKSASEAAVAGAVVVAAVAAAAPASAAAAPASAAPSVASDEVPVPRDSHENTGRGVAAAQPVPSEPQSGRRYWLAALGVLASAALVLIIIQSSGPAQEVGPFARPTAGSLTADDSTGAQKHAESKQDEKPGPQEHKGGSGGPTPTTVAPPTTQPVDPADGSGSESDDVSASGGGVEAGSTGGEELRDTSTGAAAIKKAPGPSLAERIDDGCRKVRVGDAAAGVKILEQAFEDRPHNVQLLGCLAEGKAKNEDYLGAERHYLQIAKGRNKRGYLGVARSNESLGRLERASYYYSIVLTMDANDPEATAFFRNHRMRPMAVGTAINERPEP
jgi:hypothetical protein